MKTLRVVVMLALVAGVLVWSRNDVSASGCCEKDCDDAYKTMLQSGVNKQEADAWLKGCKQDCLEHGDPTTCPGKPIPPFQQ